MKRHLLAVVGVVLGTSSLPAAAACGDFSDVDESAFYCNNVEWMKNRAVTLGCEVGLYCPDSFVLRSQMAAFMHRLGTVLTPAVSHMELDVGSIDFAILQSDSETLCATPIIPAVPYPRTAYGVAQYSSDAVVALGLNYSVNVVYSIDGVNWTPVSTVSHPVHVSVGAPGTHASTTGLVQVPADVPLQLGLRLSRATNVLALSLSASKCSLLSIVQSRDGTSTPF